MLLLRRLRLLFTHFFAFMRGGLSDIYGHHRASCAQAGVPGRRGFAVESGQHCIVMGHRGAAAADGVVLVAAGRRKERTALSWSSQGTEPSWSCLLAEWRVVGLRRRCESSGPRGTLHPQEEGGTGWHEVVFSARVFRSTRVRGIVVGAARPRGR